MFWAETCPYKQNSNLQPCQWIALSTLCENGLRFLILLPVISDKQENGMNMEVNKRLTKVMEEMDQVQNKQREVEQQKTELQNTVSKDI